MKKLVLLLIALSLVTLNFNSAGAVPVKRVLVEQHTGAWCGWCVDGVVKLDEITDKYPDKVIAVRLHNGDAMAIPEETEIGRALGLTGFPTASIDRKRWPDGKIFESRVDNQGNNYWMTLTEQRLQETPKVDVSMVYSLDKETRQFTATVAATILEEGITDDLTFNVYIREDSVSGEGSGYDQHNYYSHNSRFPDHPYYNLPSVIHGYTHMEVVRDMLGGGFGIAGSFKLADKPYEVGKTYYHTFTTVLSEDWKLKDLKFIGSVQANSSSNHEIYNCCYGTEGDPYEHSVLTLTTDENNLGGATPDNPFEKTYSVKNLTDASDTYVVKTFASNSIPGNWDITIETSGGTTLNKKESNQEDVEITVAGGETANFTLKVQPSDVYGFGDIEIFVVSKGHSDAPVGYSKVTVVSTNAENLVVQNSSQSSYSLNAYMPAGMKLMNIEPNYFIPLADKFNQVKDIIWNLGATDAIDENGAQVLQNAINNGTNVFLVGNSVISSLRYNVSNGLEFYGLEFNYMSREGYGQAPYRVWLKGVDGDPIGGDLGTDIEGNLIRYLLYMCKVQDPQKAAAFLTFRDPQDKYSGSSKVGTAQPEDAVLGARITFENSKAVLLGFTPYIIVDSQIRRKLLENIMGWLNGTIDVEENLSAEDLSISVTPNPVVGEALASYTIGGSSVQNVKISIVNQLGQTVKVITNGRQAPGLRQTMFDVNDLPSGAYSLTIAVGGVVKTIPLIINR